MADFKNTNNNNSISLENADDDHKPFYRKIPSYLYNFIFELPFENYKIYYKTGIIQKMSIEERKKLSRNVHREELHRNFFIRLIKIRPQILDDEDQINLNELNHSMKMKRGFFIIGLGLNWLYFSFNWIVLKKKKGKLFITLNFLFFFGLLWTNSIQTREYKILHEKYKNIMTREEIYDAMKRIYNIN